jgi:predicted hotdog family 3-hydroxylacyl-ACP dehydratase
MFVKLFITLALISSIAAKDTLAANECLTQGQSITSTNGCFTLDMQHDGNMVLYRSSNRQALWSSKTDRSCSNRACMQGDGNFVLYDCRNVAMWASQTPKNEGSTLTIQGDGNLVIYAWQSTRAIWSIKKQTYC